MTGLVVELAGPAGAGKTTLAQALLAVNPRATLGVPLTRGQLVHALISQSPSLLSARRSTAGRSWTRDELRSLAYLGAWQGPAAHGDVLFDHGPAFRLASLLANRTPMTCSAAFERLWERFAQDWAQLLNVVVLLDAPDDVLLRRVAERGTAHRLLDLGPEGAAALLSAYRSAYEKALARLLGGGVRLVRLDTSARSPEQLAETVTAALDPRAVR